MLHQQSRLEEARVLYQQVLNWQPRHVQALTFLGVIALQANESERALELTAKALDADPLSPATHLMQGHAQNQLRRHAAALISYDRAIALKPDLADAYLCRGNVLSELGNHEAAVASYDKALEFKPNAAETYVARGLALAALKRNEAALASFDQALGLDPRHAEAHLSRANALRDLGRLDLALASYDQAIALRSDFAQAYSNRGNLLSEFHRFDEALASYDAAISMAPEFAEAHCNRGNLLGDMGRFDDALQSFDRAIAIDPHYAQAYFSRSFVRLLLGDLENGWQDFEWRWKNEHCATSKEKRNFAQPLWLGAQSLRGKTILLQSEQGLGDTIQFCRYVKHVADLGARVVLEVPKALGTLLENLDGVMHLAVRGEPLPPFDYYCPLMSLPLALKTTLTTIPAQIPYLLSSAERVRHWKSAVGERTRPRVGLVWSGGFRLDQPELWAVNDRRNIPLAKLAALKHPAIEFHSLQKGQPAESELALLIANGWDGPELRGHASALYDFQETAALIEHLDLVISVDTATAHLAGALGKPVWILNRFDTCWRWLLDRTDSPWYPSARVYRQERAGDWDGVVQRIRRDLEQFANRDPGAAAASQRRAGRT